MCVVLARLKNGKTFLAKRKADVKDTYVHLGSSQQREESVKLDNFMSRDMCGNENKLKYEYEYSSRRKEIKRDHFDWILSMASLRLFDSNTNSSCKGKKSSTHPLRT